jgi:two-component system, chemotaxis family, chemotaxis protein CheY
MTRKALIIDDSLLLHRLYQHAFLRYGDGKVETYFATDGREGLARLQQHPDVAVILLDVNMPGMSGLEFLEALKLQPAFAHIPVVLQTTEDRGADIQRGLAAGARAYLTKPFTPQQLHRVLDAVLA